MRLIGKVGNYFGGFSIFETFAQLFGLNLAVAYWQRHPCPTSTITAGAALDCGKMEGIYAVIYHLADPAAVIWRGLGSVVQGSRDFRCGFLYRYRDSSKGGRSAESMDNPGP